MADTTEALHYEIRRLRDVVERQYLELAWQQSELRSRGGKAHMVRFDAGPLASTGRAGNAGLLVDIPELPAQEIWPTATTPSAALIPNCGFASYASANAQLPAIGIGVCGLDAERVEQIADMVEERLRRARNFRPVFLMDITRTEIFRRRGLSYEYLAPCGEKDKRHAGRLAAFNQRRVEFLKCKWDLSGIINFGAREFDAGRLKTGAVWRSRSQQQINMAVDGMLLKHAGHRAA